MARTHEKGFVRVEPLGLEPLGAAHHASAAIDPPDGSAELDPCEELELQWRGFRSELVIPNRPPPVDVDRDD